MRPRRYVGTLILSLALCFGCSDSTSKGDARRSIEGGGIYLNNRRIESTDYRVTAEDAIGGRFLVLRKGKKNYHLTVVSGARHA